MGVNHDLEEFEYTPKYDRLYALASGELPSDQIKIFYEQESDTLLFYFAYVDLAISYEVNEYYHFLLDPETEEVVSFQIDDYLEAVVIEFPRLLNLAPLAGIEDQQIEKARKRIGEDRWREAVIQQAVQDLRSTIA
jgi:hypothetical protein